jgi:CDP-2,3-bis-(O-geranylgeranyl)-sn-glycerol synthase
MQDIVFAWWFLLPAAIANAVPVFTAHIPILRDCNLPLDLGKTFKGIRIFGPNKTWRGLISGILAATLVLALQRLMGDIGLFETVSQFKDYRSMPMLVLGPLLGLGALGGDAIESFFKRQRGIPSGQSWIPFDQIDYILGSIAITLPLIKLSLIHYILMLMVWSLLHVLATYTGWCLGLKDQPI